MKSRFLFYWGLAIGAFSLLYISLCIIPYYRTFKDYDFSDKPADWGTFGDYFGGILNPYFGLVSLIIVVLFSVYTSKKEDQRIKEQNEAEHNRIKEQQVLEDVRHKSNLDLQQRIALFQVRFQIIKDFTSKLDEFIGAVEGFTEGKTSHHEKLLPLLSYFSFFLNAYENSFTITKNKDFKKLYNDLVIKMNGLKKFGEKIKNKGLKNIVTGTDIGDELAKLSNDFYNHRARISALLQKDLQEPFN